MAVKRIIDAEISAPMEINDLLAKEIIVGRRPPVDPNVPVNSMRPSEDNSFKF